MSEKVFKLEIVTPFNLVFSGDVKYVRVPGVEGLFGVLDRHTPFLTALQIGEIKVEDPKDTRYFATSGGIVEVLPDSVTILAETADEAHEIDFARAEEAVKRARKRLSERKHDVDTVRAHNALYRAINRMRIARRAKAI